MSDHEYDEEEYSGGNYGASSTSLSRAGSPSASSTSNKCTYIYPFCINIYVIYFVCRKVRKNHNEFERRRRDAQRQRLEELRISIPGLDPKASMVTVLTEARRFIEELQERNAMLEAGGGRGSGMPATARPAAVNTGFCPIQPKAPSTTPRLQSLNQAPPAPKIYHTAALTSHGYGAATAAAIGPSSNLLAKSMQPRQEETFRQGREQLVDNLPYSTGASHNAPSTTPIIMGNSTATTANVYPNMTRPSLISSVIQESFMMPNNPSDPASAAKRRDSGLLLPTDDPSIFYFGHRDSIQTMMAVPLPMILDDTSEAYVSCQKCQRGVDGLVMIDCDKCHRWYHIRCVGIDATSIPITWKCPECPSH